MRTRIEVLNRQVGSILMMTLFSAMLIGVVLAGYLTLVQHQETTVSRSQGWNAALTLAEAGVEEALAQMNSGDLSANGWGPPSGGSFNLQSRALAGGRYDVRYDTNTSSSPTIVSIGYVNLPASSATVSRQVKVSTKAVPLINVAVAAKYGITLSSGSGVTVDSFNSANNTHSDFGRYPPASQSWKLLTNGDVGSVYGPVSLGTPNIKGDLYLGPAATNSVVANQVSGRIYNDFNVDYPDVVAPAGAPGGSGWFLDNADPHIFSGSSYTCVINDSHKIIVRGGSKVTLYVTTANFSPSEIQIQTNLAGASGSLTIYQVSGSASFMGNGALAVDSRRADSFSYFGLPGVTSVTYNGNGNPFFGVIYAPSANLTLNGGGYMVGACIGRSITMGTSYSFHFDENLLKVGPMRGYLAKSWEEL